jgi:hypothetical protein
MERIFWALNFFLQWGAFSQRLIPMASRIHWHVITRLVWCTISQNMMISPIFFDSPSTSNIIVKWLFTCDWIFKWEQNCLWLLPTGRWYSTHSLCFHDTTVWCVRGENDFKGCLATTVARSYTPWLLVCGSNERRSLQRQSPHSLNWESYCKIHQECHSDWIVKCLSKQDKTCRCVSTSTWGRFPTFIVM